MGTPTFYKNQFFTLIKSESMPIKWERIVKNGGSMGIFCFHIQLKAMSVHLFNPLFQLDINLPQKKQYTKGY